MSDRWWPRGDRPLDGGWYWLRRPGGPDEPVWLAEGGGFGLVVQYFSAYEPRNLSDQSFDDCQFSLLEEPDVHRWALYGEGGMSESEEQRHATWDLLQALREEALPSPAVGEPGGTAAVYNSGLYDALTIVKAWLRGEEKPEIG